MPENTFLRIGVTGGGCSGFSYSLSFDDQYDAAKDSKFDQHGVEVVVDKKSALISMEPPLIGSIALKSKALLSRTPTQ